MNCRDCKRPIEDVDVSSVECDPVNGKRAWCRWCRPPEAVADTGIDPADWWKQEASPK